MFDADLSQLRIHQIVVILARDGVQNASQIERLKGRSHSPANPNLNILKQSPLPKRIIKVPH